MLQKSKAVIKARGKAYWDFLVVDNSIFFSLNIGYFYIYFSTWSDKTSAIKSFSLICLRYVPWSQNVQLLDIVLYLWFVYLQLSKHGGWSSSKGGIHSSLVPAVPVVLDLIAFAHLKALHTFYIKPCLVKKIFKYVAWSQ